MIQPMFLQRHVIAGILCICSCICYADRTNIGIAISKFINEKETQGIVLSSFFYGYMSTQFLAAWFASRIGPKVVLLIGVIVWSFCDVCTIFFSKSLPLLLLARAGMGCGEGVLMPCLHLFAASWYPKQERSRLVVITACGQDLGSIIALAVSPILMQAYGWQSIFIFFGVLSVIWVICHVLWVSSTPEDNAFITESEKKYIAANRQKNSKSGHDSANQKTPWGTLLKHPSAWGVYIAHFCFNYGWYVLLSWLPQYLEQARGIDLKKDALLAITPSFCGFLGMLSFGHISDHLLAKGFPILFVRRLMNSIGLFGPAINLFLLQYVTSPINAIVLLSFALFTARASGSGYWVNMIDLGPSQSGQMMGISNTIATIPGILGNVLTGYILETTHSWSLVFAVASAILTLGGIAFLLLSSASNIYPAACPPEDLEALEARPFLSASDLSVE